MTTHRVSWTSGLGIPESTVLADLDYDHERVTVTTGGLHDMIVGWRQSGILNDEDTEETVRALRELPMDHGRIDVTEAGGGWQQWVDSILECGCGHRSHPDRPCDGTGAELDVEYGVDPAEACICMTSVEV